MTKKQGFLIGAEQFLKIISLYIAIVITFVIIIFLFKYFCTDKHNM